MRAHPKCACCGLMLAGWAAERNIRQRGGADPVHRGAHQGPDHRGGHVAAGLRAVEPAPGPGCARPLRLVACMGLAAALCMAFVWRTRATCFAPLAERRRLQCPAVAHRLKPCWSQQGAKTGYGRRVLLPVWRHALQGAELQHDGQQGVLQPAVYGLVRRIRVRLRVNPET